MALEHGLNSCGAQARLLCSMLGLPGPGIKPVSPALTGRFFTTEPPGKPYIVFRYNATVTERSVGSGCSPLNSQINRPGWWRGEFALISDDGDEGGGVEGEVAGGDGGQTSVQRPTPPKHPPLATGRVRAFIG